MCRSRFPRRPPNVGGGLDAPRTLLPALLAVAPVMWAVQDAKLPRTDAESGPMALGSLCSVATGCRASRSVKRSNEEGCMRCPVALPVFLALVLVAFSPHPARCQSPPPLPPPREELERLGSEIQALQREYSERIASLEARMNALQAAATAAPPPAAPAPAAGAGLPAPTAAAPPQAAVPAGPGGGGGPEGGGPPPFGRGSRAAERPCTRPPPHRAVCVP